VLDITHPYENYKYEAGIPGYEKPDSLRQSAAETTYNILADE
jgi:hypothetical protein